MFIPLWLLLAPAGAAGWGGDLSPAHDFGIGPYFAYGYGSCHGGAAGLDVSYTWSVLSAAAELRYLHHGGDDLAGPAAGLCVYLLVNVCFEAGYLWGSERGPVYDLFFGVPFGDDLLPDSLLPFRSGYLEPYYRLNYLDIGGGLTLHEFGLLVKITTWTI